LRWVMSSRLVGLLVGVSVASKKFWSDMLVSCGDAVAAAGL
jgi:hypothetical protein